jgi:hypothetical protein
VVAAVFVTVAVPGVASAQGDAGVDESTGPASFVNVAAVKVGDQGTNGGTVITETQRSPLRAGQSTLSQDRASVPKNGDKGETDSIGPNYVVHFGRFNAPGPFPAGVKSREHKVVAALQFTNVPAAVAETHYALLDNARRGTGPTDRTVLAFENAKTSVECSAPKKVTVTTAADKLWVRDDRDQLVRVPVPASGKPLHITGVKLGAPSPVPDADPAKTTSELTISQLTSFDQLIKQNGWRSGDITVAAGWQVDIVTHLVTSGGTAENVHTRMVLGGVSCSLPKGFAAKAAVTTTPGTATQPAVPMSIPAGGDAQEAGAGSAPVLGYELMGGGALLAAGAVLVLRRRRPVPRVDPE